MIEGEGEEPVGVIPHLPVVVPAIDIETAKGAELDWKDLLGKVCVLFQLPDLAGTAARDPGSPWYERRHAGSAVDGAVRVESLRAKQGASFLVEREPHPRLAAGGQGEPVGEPLQIGHLFGRADLIAHRWFGGSGHLNCGGRAGGPGNGQHPGPG